jgi:Ala-tRNA(Pro) deacylase
MPATEADLLAQLDALGVAWTRHAHAPVFTVEEARAATGHLPGLHVKNLFLRDRAGAFWLATCRDDRAFRLRELGRAVGLKDPSFASAEALRATLGVEPGSVTPLALVNDRPPRVRFVIDRAVAAADLVNVHPLRNDATLALSPQGLARLLDATGHVATEVDFDALGNALGASPPPAAAG